MIIENKINFNKIRDVKFPERQKGRIGIDFFIPYYSEEYLSELKKYNQVQFIQINHGYITEKGDVGESNYLFLKPHERVTILSGIQGLFDSGTILTAINEGELFIKGLLLTSHIIEKNELDELVFELINPTTNASHIYFGEKLIRAAPFLHNTGSIGFTEGNLYGEGMGLQ